jgi:hypothetical protein
MSFKEKKYFLYKSIYEFLLILFVYCFFNSMVQGKEMENQEKLIFSTILYSSQRSETNTLLMVESIRAFGGALLEAPIWCFIPENGEQLSKTIRDKLIPLDVTLIPFEIDKNILSFPFAGFVHASALAESLAIGKAEFLIWLGTNTIILQEPDQFLLPNDKNLGYRPVHHTLIGSHFDEPLDNFWKLIYKYCNVTKKSIFPMMTHVDETTIRPYFNAGILAIRPEKHLLRDWCKTFFRIYKKQEFLELYNQDKLYSIFMHQAVLSGTILSTFEKNEIKELPPTYNYPVHLYSEDNTEKRPSTLEELVTFRHEGFYEDPEWMDKLPAEEPLKKWLAEHLP